MSPRFTRRQALENQRFLAALRRTGNARLAARELGVHRSTYLKRRARSAAFAAEWDMALAAAHAAFHLAGGERLPEPGDSHFHARKAETARSATESDCPRPSPPSLRTRGGEPEIVRLRSGKLQLRLAPPGRMTKAGEQAFFRALSASANVRLSAAAAGFAHSSFYARRRRWSGFAEEMKVSLSIGYDRLEYAVMERAGEALADPEERAWLSPALAGNPVAPIAFGQAFQLLCLHRNTVRLGGRLPPCGRPYGGAADLPGAMQAVLRCVDAVERATRFERVGSWRFEHEPAPPELPPLETVTGWSKADPANKPHHPDVAMFGGWRIQDWKKRRGTG